MRRRAFIAGLSSGVARWLLSAMPAVAQQKIARVGVRTPGGSDRTPSVEAFHPPGPPMTLGNMRELGQARRQPHERPRLG
jgi:hypothetical protein